MGLVQRAVFVLVETWRHMIIIASYFDCMECTNSSFAIERCSLWLSRPSTSFQNDSTAPSLDYKARSTLTLSDYDGNRKYGRSCISKRFAELHLPWCNCHMGDFGIWSYAHEPRNRYKNYAGLPYRVKILVTSYILNAEHDANSRIYEITAPSSLFLALSMEEHNTSTRPTVNSEKYVSKSQNLLLK